MQEGKIGNQNAVGPHAPGSGRKSAYEEKRDAEFLSDIFYNCQDVNEIQEKLKGRKYSVATALVAKALMGNEKIMVEIFKKIFPDKIEAQNRNYTLTDVITKLQEKYDKPNNTTAPTTPDKQPPVKLQQPKSGVPADSKQTGADSTAKIQ